MGAENQGLFAMKLENRISTLKYCLFCFSVILFILGAIMFGFTIAVRAEEGVQTWVESLEIGEYYIGLYMLIVFSFIAMVFSVIACGVSLIEHQLGLLVNAGLQGFTFLGTLVGSSVLMNFSTIDSAIEPLIRDSMLNLISQSQRESVASLLRLVQEGVGCCGANGPNDYLRYSKPVPSECRDSVTGNVFFHSCTEEITWSLQAQSDWVVTMATGICILNVIIGVLSLVLVSALKKEEQTVSYKR